MPVKTKIEVIILVAVTKGTNNLKYKIHNLVFKNELGNMYVNLYFRVYGCILCACNMSL